MQIQILASLLFSLQILQRPLLQQPEQFLQLPELLQQPEQFLQLPELLQLSAPQQELLLLRRPERRRPELIKASRKRRIATGSGNSVQDVNRLLKQFQEASRVMKKMSRMGKKGLARHGLSGMLPPGGGFPR